MIDDMAGSISGATRHWLLVGCVVTACHHDAPPTMVAAPRASSCDQLADHVMSLMSAAHKAKPEELDPFRNVLSKRCTEDHWSAEAQRCLAGITTLLEGDKCERLLTPAQAKALELDGQAAGRAFEDPAPPMNAPAAPAASTPKSLKKARSMPARGDSDPCEGGE